MPCCIPYEQSMTCMANDHEASIRALDGAVAVAGAASVRAAGSL